MGVVKCTGQLMGYINSAKGSCDKVNLDVEVMEDLQRCFIYAKRGWKCCRFNFLSAVKEASETPPKTLGHEAGNDFTARAFTPDTSAWASQRRTEGISTLDNGSTEKLWDAASSACDGSPALAGRNFLAVKTVNRARGGCRSAFENEKDIDKKKCMKEVDGKKTYWNPRAGKEQEAADTLQARLFVMFRGE